MEAVQGVGGKYIREVKGMMSSELEQVSDKKCSEFNCEDRGAKIEATC